MASAGAPTAYIASNALAIGAVMIAGFFVWRRPMPSNFIAVAALLMLGATFAGQGIDGVHRWIALGQLKLHVGMLVLPLLAIILPQQDKRAACAIVAVAALIFAFQPDRASAFALCSICLLWFVLARHRWAFVALLLVLCSLIRTITIADGLLPVRFVENVLIDASTYSPLLAVIMILAIIVALATPMWGAYSQPEANPVSRAMWSACLAGYFLASLTGPYPTPLLGYGVSAILGFGIALSLSASTVRSGSRLLR